ncbi:c-type cytochrome [Salinisphaera sp. S4-8]|uniref:c-type cytochrome n=1 Tax=Salinisphaera sp. S4-8 TaxID=633357 RepID=UPI003340A6A2
MRYRPIVVPMLLSLATLASAATPDGAMLAGACTACHGPHGRSVGAVPSLAGLARSRFIERMQAYRRGDDEGTADGPTTIMNRIAPGYDDAEIAALADYFATFERADHGEHHAP